MSDERTPTRTKARELARALRKEHPDYAYLKQVFRYVREELDLTHPSPTRQKLPVVPTEDEIRRYYEAVWQARNVQDMFIIKMLLYTGVRVSELIRIRLDAVDLDRCQIRITQGKGGKDRIVPFPGGFKEALAVHMAGMRKARATYLFESVRCRPYSDRGIRKILAKYAAQAGLAHPISPHRLRHFLLTWLKKQGIDDALIQPYSGHASRQSLEIYSRLAIGEAQAAYDQVMDKFPV
ncbi:MAG TPA: tyrosine-type recombinase/integrase [Terriglobales bacterium]|nr:tyrosine-type recombinase/integrase [Terriglobales bacterium]